MSKLLIINIYIRYYIYTHMFKHNHIWVQWLQTCIRDHKHVHFLIWSFLKLIITAMSSQLISITLSAETCLAVLKQSATVEKFHTSSQFKMIRLIRELENLLLLKNTKFYCKLWQELKLKMSKSLKIIYIITDNAHIVELINTVKTMISKQKQQMTALMKVNTYITTL